MVLNLPELIYLVAFYLLNISIDSVKYNQWKIIRIKRRLNIDDFYYLQNQLTINYTLIKIIA